MNTVYQNEAAKCSIGNNEVADRSQNKNNEVKNITKEVFQHRLIRKQGEDELPHIIHEEITKKNVLDNSLKQSDNEICNIIRRECNDTEVLKTIKGIYVEGKVNRRNARFLVDSGADVTLISLTTLKQFPERLRTKW